MDWKRIRSEYEKEDVSVAALARRHGCNESTIRRKARREGWSRAGRKGRKGVRDPRISMLNEHLRLWTGVKKRLAKGIEKGSIEDLRAAKTACEAVSTVVKGEREVWGLNDIGCGLDETMEIAGEMDRVTVPPGTGPSVEGEETLRSGAGGKKERKDGTGEEEACSGPRRK